MGMYCANLATTLITTSCSKVPLAAIATVIAAVSTIAATGVRRRVVARQRGGQLAALGEG